MSFYEGLVEVRVYPANREEAEKLEAYTQEWAKKASRYAKPNLIDKNTWLLESDWKPGIIQTEGQLIIESELVNKSTVNSVRQYLQGIIDRGIDATFQAKVDVTDVSGSGSCDIHRTYGSGKMRARSKK